jgi:oligopeptide/dipeptide ABC transporter ATP-binding protein
MLLRSIPRVDRDMGGLETIPGQVPAISRMPAGCRFRERCPLARPICAEKDPLLVPVAGDEAHAARCWVRAPIVSEAVHA